MSNVKLTDRAILLLHIVGENTDRDPNTGELTRFFVPQPSIGGAYHVTFRGKRLSTDIYGGGDASALRGLESRGLIKRPKASLSGKYIYAITEDGLKVLADNWTLFE